jgi:SAM-dependent methyltransferase
VWYPIASGVPVLLVFPTAFQAGFAREHAARIERLEGYGAPRRAPRPDEASVQATFTEEWARVTDSELSFTYSDREQADLVRDVWLKWAGQPDRAEPVRTVLEVGCGLGSESMALREVLDAQVFAVDLNLALLERSANRSRDGVHFVVASLYDLPFRRASFDLVYSAGVLHHMRSTEAAFAEAATYVRDRGSLFVWVYGLDDHLAVRGRRGVARRAGLAAERVLRPGLSRAPRRAREAFFATASRAAYPLLRRTTRHAAHWSVADTDHYLRDLFSPRYAHRHSFNEVIAWFEDRGFDVVDVHSPRNYRELIGKQLWGVGVTGTRRQPITPGPRPHALR